MQSKYARMWTVLILGSVPMFPARAQNGQADGNSGVAVPEAGKSNAVRIFYSGRMLGYLRLDKEGDKTSPSDPAELFMEAYQRNCPNPPCILLGMGDNFAPDYEARIADDKQFKRRNAPGTSAEKDNVARFLQTAQFSALVPGKEDFYFGAYRLRKIADTYGPNKDGGPFLADNLVLRPKDEKMREPWSEDKKVFTDKVDGITTKFPGNAMPWLVKLSFTLDPKKIAIDSANFGGYLCRAKRNPDDIPAKNVVNDPECEKWALDPTGVFIRSSAKQETPAPGTEPKPRNDLAPGADYGFCLTGITFRSRQNAKPYCLPVHIEVPMFSAPYVFAHDKANNVEVAVFAVVDPEIRSYLPRQNAGWDVTDRDRLLKESLDLKNGNWLPHRVEIDALSPDFALQGAFDAFLLDHPDFSGTTALMAQMDYASADEMARRVKPPKALAPRGPAFDLIIARADSAHQTDSLTITLSQTTNVRPRFVAVPPPAWDERKQQVQVPLGWVDLVRSDTWAKASFHAGIDYCSRKDESGNPLPDPKGCNAGRESQAWSELAGRLFRGSDLEPYKECYRAIGNSTPDDCESKKIAGCLMKFATCAMMQDNKTFDAEASDAAILQDRDIWVPENGEDPEYDKDKEKDRSVRAWRVLMADDAAFPPVHTVQGILDQIFWKDDLLTHASLSGSELKALVKKSKSNKKEENSPVWILRDTRGRGLEFAGLLEGVDPKPGAKEASFYAHLEELSDSSLYRVAASSYISNGDTGYAEFATPAAGKVEFIRPNKTGVRISVLICEALREGASRPELYQCGDPGKAQKDEATRVKQSDYAVTKEDTQTIAGLQIHDDRDQDSPGEYLEAQVRELVIGRDPFSKKAFAEQPENRSERHVQNYPYLDVNLEKLAIAGNLNTALASKAQTANFSGVLQSDIPQGTKSEFSWFAKIRVLDRRGRWDFGGAIDEQFDKSVLGSLTGPSSSNWSFNSLTVGPIVQFSMSDPRRTPRHLLAFHLSDYTRQITNISLSLTGKNNSASFTLNQLPSYGFQPKGGYRYESGDSYLEAGGLYVRNYDVLSEVAGLPNGAVCNLSGSVSLAACVGNIVFPSGWPSPILHYSTFGQAGLYWDSKLSIEVLKGKWSYELTSRGNYFPSSDNVSALTRLDVRVGNSLKFPLFGNVSIVPTAEWRFFENQGTRDYLKRINTSVSLNYSFHKDSRVRLLDAMRYKPSSSNP